MKSTLHVLDFVGASTGATSSAKIKRSVADRGGSWATFSVSVEEERIEFAFLWCTIFKCGPLETTFLYGRLIMHIGREYIGGG